MSIEYSWRHRVVPTDADRVMVDQLKQFQLAGEGDQQFVQRIASLFLGYVPNISEAKSYPLGVSYGPRRAFGLRVFEPGMGLPTNREEWIELLQSGACEVVDDAELPVSPDIIIQKLSQPIVKGMLRTTSEYPFEVVNRSDYAVDEFSYDIG